MLGVLRLCYSVYREFVWVVFWSSKKNTPEVLATWPDLCVDGSCFTCR